MPIKRSDLLRHLDPDLIRAGQDADAPQRGVMDRSDVLRVKDGITVPGTINGWGSIYIDTSDGDLKIKFGDGTVEMLASDSGAGPYVRRDGTVNLTADWDAGAFDITADNFLSREYLYHDGDADTYLRFEDDKITFVAGNTTMLSLVETTQDEIVVNDNGGDVNFRVENSLTANMVYVGGSAREVGIGTNTPALSVGGTGIDIVDTDILAEFKLHNSYSGYGALDGVNISIYTTDFYLTNREAGKTRFFVNGSERLTIDSAGQIGIGTASPGSLTEWNMSTEDLEFVNAGSTGATEQDWIEVQVGGVTGYLRVFASK